MKSRDKMGWEWVLTKQANGWAAEPEDPTQHNPLSGEVFESESEIRRAIRDLPEDMLWGDK